MSYEELSLGGFINEVKEVSSGPHSRKFCFVLGAGASKTSGIKSGQELVDIWDKELLERNYEEHLKWKKKNGINDENKDSFYSEYYERRFRRQPVDGYNYLEKLMEKAKPSIGYVMLSHLLTKTDHNVVITTNFDHLTEDAINYYEQTIPLVIGHETLAHYVSKQINRPTIIKIHRDLLFDPKSTSDELEILHENWKKALNTIFSEYHPVFIGYAGNDNSLMDFLLKNSGRFVSGEWSFPYWMIYKTEEIGGKVLDFLEKTDGYLIRHSGFDDVLFMLGAAFDYKLPTKEDFLSDAEKRFQTLSDYIDEFTENSVDVSKKTEEMIDKYKPETVEETEINQAIQQIADQTELQSMYREAVWLHSMGEYEEALEIKRELVEMEPENARYQESLSTTLHEMGRYEEALEASQRAINLEPQNARYHDSLSITLHKMGRYEEALEAEEEAIEIEPDNARYYNNLGITLHEMGRYEKALEAEEKAKEIKPDNARYYHSYGVTLHEMGCYEDALKEKQRAIELESDNASYYDSLSTTLHKMGRYEEALEAEEEAIEIEPDNASYYDSLGTTLHEMGCYEDALKEKQRAIELESDNARYYHSYGVTLHEMGCYEDALKEKQRAIELESDNARYYDSLSTTLHKMGRYEEALEADQKAIELEPGNASYYDSLSITLHEMGRYEEALEASQRAIELEPDNEEYKANLDDIRKKMEKE